MAEMLGECCEKKSEAYTCPMTQFVNLISTALALARVMSNYSFSINRFGDLLRAAAPITQKELTKQLRLFEQRGLVTRTVYPEIPPRVEYQITGLGLTLQDALSPLAAWMSEYGDQLER